MITKLIQKLTIKLNGNSPFSKKFKVLIAEDDIMMKPLLSQVILSLEGEVEITWTSSGEDAIKEFSNSRFDLIITDYLLNGSSTGADVLAFCKEHLGEEWLRNWPIAIFTWRFLKSNRKFFNT